VGCDEQEVVRAFLEAVHALEFTLRQTVAAALGKRKSVSGGGQADLDLEQRISDALSAATAEEWPSAILDYAEADQFIV